MSKPVVAEKDAESALYDEYKAWCFDHGYKWMSADELLAELATRDAPAADLKYLNEFIERWDAAVSP